MHLLYVYGQYIETNKYIFHPQSVDYVSGGELFTHLYQRERFAEDEVRIYIAEIILALEHLHKVILLLETLFEKRTMCTLI